MYIIKTPNFIQNLFPNFVWRMKSVDSKTIYLTFDDGPIPEVTPWVLDTLKSFDAKATFFCVGDNVRKHPEVFQRVLAEGHLVGNHTYHHLSGWNTDNIPYFHDVRKCARLVRSKLFRPPYGRMKPQQVQFLQRHYKIIMWDVLSADFDQDTSPEQCLQNVVAHAQPGSIVVFHDSVKAFKNLQYVLPKCLDFFRTSGYDFKIINEDSLVSGAETKKIA